MVNSRTTGMVARSLRGIGRRFGCRMATDGGFDGRFASWDEACKAACARGEGYDQQQILDQVAWATREVIAGRAAFERDSVLFERPDYPYPVLACLLQLAAGNKGQLSVLDFGGALGSMYHQCRPFLRGLERLRWRVVEQPHFVAVGRADFQTDELQFFTTVAECLSVEAPDVALFSGVLQYLEEPQIPVDAVCRAGVAVLVDRTPMVATEMDVFTVQTVPASIYAASLPFRAFGTKSLQRLIPADYVRVADFDALDGDIRVGAVNLQFKGFFGKKIGNV